MLTASLKGGSMGRMKDLMMEYVEHKHPNDYEKQDELFNKILSGEAGITVDDMLLVVKRKGKTK
jgi:hypothetical protein